MSSPALRLRKLLKSSSSLDSVLPELLKSSSSVDSNLPNNDTPPATTTLTSSSSPEMKVRGMPKLQKADEQKVDSFIISRAAKNDSPTFSGRTLFGDGVGNVAVDLASNNSEVNGELELH